MVKLLTKATQAFLITAGQQPDNARIVTKAAHSNLWPLRLPNGR